MKNDKILKKLDDYDIHRREFIGGALAVAVGSALFPVVGFAGQSKAHTDPWKYARTLKKKIQPPKFPNRDFPVTDFGAKGDNKTDCTEAINKAISACSKAGGGRVVVPEGDYRTGAVHLLSNVNLHIEEGATLSFYIEPERYLPHVFTRFEGTEYMGYSPLIYAYEQENIAITGAGTLDGRAKVENWWSWKEGKLGNSPANPTKDSLVAMAAEGVPPEQRVFGDDNRLRPSFVQPYKCRNVLIEGIRVRRAPFWQIHPVLCTNVLVRGVNVKSHGFNNDGCNPESCRYVLIEDCRFDTGDDCIAIKSGRNADGRRVNVPSEDIMVTKCKMKAGHGGVVVGSEMSGGVRNVYVEDCQMSSPDLWYMLRIKTNSLRGGFVENIHVRDIEVGTIGKAAIRINFHYSDGDVGEFVPRVSNVTVTDVTGDDIRQVLSLQGYERSPVQNVHLSNCRFKGVKEADIIEHVDNLVLDNVYSDFGK